GIRSVFNILGPITNPADVKRQLVGVFNLEVAGLLAEVLQQLDAHHVLLVHSEDGLDEISLQGYTHIIEVKDGKIREDQV
ncbi:anthranilate phosphoribosyltransferase, partial [candidate division KSB1 bacterium]|nr:anthranilate phosphoribosyltransferase [candidate division KSB1 bacterium]NIS27480.1 anthranilate phosphoribosyltransferase [candidate division KSB1 bacterium]NIT74335.1 anthranilate phosphoribosyltransferase [candidate division KSB1 bacterium]NIU28191.1 anthranilate phosphoribosyltransferase [candidate division KSB1 bacterium]NIU90876.1 anthranilate phosphoribosyltransferase [candidate division KSB1 bacterium]